MHGNSYPAVPDRHFMRFKINPNGIRFRLFIMGGTPALLLVVSLTSYFVEHQLHHLEVSLHERGKTVAKQLAVASIYGVFSGNKPMLREMCNDLLTEKDIAFVTIRSLNGEILAHASNILETDSDRLKIFKVPVTIQSLRQSSTAVDFNLFEFAEKDGDKEIGTVMVGLSQEPIQDARRQFLINSLTIIAGCVVFTLLLAFRLSKSISTPLINLTQVANDLANGNMDARASKAGTTEIAALCDSFNVMAIGLQQTQNYLLQQVDNAVKELTAAMQELERKNRSLEKTTQLAIAQNETKSQFLAHISHEIRTPMNGIIGFIDLLSRSKLNPCQLEQARLIKTSACNLLTIVNEILDYSSLETGNFKTDATVFNIRECIENTVTAIIPRSREVQIVIDIAPELPTLVNSDSIRLSQVLTNLVGNACKYTNRGYIIVRCTLTKKSRLFVSVTDSGIGIAEDLMKDLFHPFLPRSNHSADKEPGTGLGLTIAKNIVEKLGGTIGVRSLLGRGSVFWFDVPVKTFEETRTYSPDTAIYVVDPIAVRRKALLKQISHLGFSSRGFASLRQLTRQPGKTREIVFYAASRLDSDADFNAELVRIKTITGHLKVIFIAHQLQTSCAADILPLPCRSSFLQQIITNAFSPISKDSSVAVKSKANTASPRFRVLIADDNEINRLLLKSQLESRSDDITIAEDGKQALSLLRQRKYQLILLDLQMPYLNGLELLEQIKKPDCINHDSPIIAITAHAQSHQRKKLIDAGFDECLIKPVLLEQLEEVLNLWQPLVQEAERKPADGLLYLQQMLEKTSNNKQLAETLFNRLFLELPAQAIEIRQAIDNHDWELAREITHKLHGSVGFCGLAFLKETAHELEVNLSNLETDAAQRNVTLLKQRIDHFTRQKQTILRALDGS